MKIRLVLSAPGAIEGAGALQHVRRPQHSSTFCGQFVPANGWSTPGVDVELEDVWDLPEEIRARICLKCLAGVGEAIQSLEPGA